MLGRCGEPKLHGSRQDAVHTSCNVHVTSKLQSQSSTKQATQLSIACQGAPPPGRYALRSVSWLSVVSPAMVQPHICMKTAKPLPRADDTAHHRPLHSAALCLTASLTATPVTATPRGATGSCKGMDSTQSHACDNA